MTTVATGRDTATLTICLSHADPIPPAGTASFASVSLALHQAWETARELVRVFDPQVVVLFGPDHRRAFREVIPTVAVALSASGRGDRGGPVGPYQVPSELSRTLASGLVAREIDVAVAYRPQLDHGFGLTARDLLGGLDHYPIIPVFLNSASPPVPTFGRAAAIGRAVHDVMAGTGQRTLYVGSGGLTHDLPGFYPLDDGVDWPEDERLRRNARLNTELKVPGRSFSSEWDHEVLRGLASADASWLGTVGQDVNRRAGNGGNEVLTWVAAWAAGGEPLTTLQYEFNESHGSGTAVAASASAVVLHGAEIAG